jgi:PAS domain S-box-containing protein
MLRLARRSLLIQLLSVYLLFVLVVMIGGIEVNAAIEQKLRSDAEASGQALAQEIALNTSIQLNDEERALIGLSNQIKALGFAGQNIDKVAIERVMSTFQASRSDAGQVYWIDPFGDLLISCSPGATPSTAPTCNDRLYTEFSPPEVIEEARVSNTPVYEVGVAVETPVSNQFNAGVIFAEPVQTSRGGLSGIVAANISLNNLSVPLENVVQAQAKQNRKLQISIIDDQGNLVASPNHTQILFNVLYSLPGAAGALQGSVNSTLGPGPDGTSWLFSSVPVPDFGWAVVVQRPANEALAVVDQLHLWLIAAGLLFTIGGLLFWLMLFLRVIRPLHTMAKQHQTLPESEQSIPVHATVVARRSDEVGGLARSLVRLERDGLEKLSELRTLLETSNVVVGSLDPHAVVKKIIGEVRRLVDVQAAAVLLPDERGVLRVLVSEGHKASYEQAVALSPGNASSSAVLAMRDGRPVQKLLDGDQPSVSYEEGFRAALAIPIISRHAGSIVLLVHRDRSQLFDQNEIDLLLTFANYAMLAWEHAVLYERSDVRLREVAQENEQLYRQASEEKQKLEAIMGSMSDGLVLTGSDGTVLYANAGASAIVGVTSEALERRSISKLYDALRDAAVDPEECELSLELAESLATPETVVELRRDGQRHAIHLRLFDVGDQSKQIIGRGLLLRDVTREREIDEFKSTLLAAVGHEVRTPLAAIKGYASTLLQEDVTWSDSDQRYFLQTISGEADRLALLVSNLLDLSRQEAGLLLLNRTPTRVRDLVAKVIERHPGHDITADIPGDLPLVNVDSARIEVVLTNLVANALSYGEGEVRIAAVQRKEQVIVSVTDNGPGIAADELPHVFERFYRAGHGRQRHSGGTGLGLTICKAFVEAHSCSIWAESDSQGTTISFSLPTAAPARDIFDTSVTGDTSETSDTGATEYTIRAELSAQKERG